MPGSPVAAVPASHPDPHQDRPPAVAPCTSRIGRALNLVRKLIDYGKQLATALQQRTAATNLAEVMRNFGTADVALILVSIIRGLDRAAALEAWLLTRLAREAQQRPAAPPRAAQPADRSAGAAGADRPPPSQDSAAQVRRRPTGAVIADICRDLGIVPSNKLWRELASVLIENDGNLATLFKDIANRMKPAGFFPPDMAMMPPGWQPPPAASGAGPP
jgi:hypothetical protein